MILIVVVVGVCLESVSHCLAGPPLICTTELHPQLLLPLVGVVTCTQILTGILQQLISDTMASLLVFKLESVRT
jgi:hypothetical protein